MTHPRVQAIAFFNEAVRIAPTDQQLAYRFLLSAIDIDPRMPEAWYQTGCANTDFKLTEAAVACHRRALEIAPLDDKMWTNLGHQLFHLGRLDEAEAATKRAIELNKDAPNPWCNLSLIRSVQGKNQSALELALKAHELAPQEPTIEIQLAFAYLFAGQWKLGLKHFESRFPYRLTQFLSLPYPPWKGEDVDGKTVFVVAEQGMGDTLSLLRFVPAVLKRGARVTLQIQPDLLRLAGMMLPPHERLSIAPLGTYPEADFWCSMTSLPVALDLSSEEIANAPGLPVPHIPLANDVQWKLRESRFHIGIAWAGATNNDIDKWRSMDILNFLALYKIPGIQLYGLQIGPRAADIHNTGSAALVRDLSPFIRDVADTIAIIRDLDLIITVETSLGHIAGAVDAECWILASYHGGDWRIGRTGTKSLWYKRHRVFRQDESAQWHPVFNRVINALKERLGK